MAIRDGTRSPLSSDDVVIDRQVWARMTTGLERTHSSLALLFTSMSWLKSPVNQPMTRRVPWPSITIGTMQKASSCVSAHFWLVNSLDLSKFGDSFEIDWPLLRTLLYTPSSIRR